MADAHVAVARTQRAIVVHFTAHAADAPERAMGFNPTRNSEAALFGRLRAQGVVREASPGLFYVDRERLAARRSAAAVRVLGVGAAAGVLLAGLGALRTRRRQAEKPGGLKRLR